MTRARRLRLRSATFSTLTFSFLFAFAALCPVGLSCGNRTFLHLGLAAALSLFGRDPFLDLLGLDHDALALFQHRKVLCALDCAVVFAFELIGQLQSDPVALGKLGGAHE